MLFYFIVHTILGFNAGNLANLQMKARQQIGASPLWLHGGYGYIGGAGCVFAAFAAPVTTLFQWGLGWTLVTIGELILGAVLAGILPIPLRLLLAAIGPVVTVVVMGALWGFWYI